MTEDGQVSNLHRYTCAFLTTYLLEPHTHAPNDEGNGGSGVQVSKQDDLSADDDDRKEVIDLGDRDFVSIKKIHIYN